MKRCEIKVGDIVKIVSHAKDKRNYSNEDAPIGSLYRVSNSECVSIMCGGNRIKEGTFDCEDFGSNYANYYFNWQVELATEQERFLYYTHGSFCLVEGYNESS